jgi:lactoylglutathione lyase
MKLSKSILLLLVILQLLISVENIAQTISRPPIVGLAHVSFKVSDIEKARQFYGNLLGYNEAFTFFQNDNQVSVAFFKVNDEQYIELTPNLKPDEVDRLNHFCLETTDIEMMRQYLSSKGVQVPEKLLVGRDKNLHFTVKGPDGHTVEFVQQLPEGKHNEMRGKYNIDIEGVSKRIQHMGITVRDAANADKFYKVILGFSELWRGGVNDTVTNYINMKLPESSDYIEYMIVDQTITPERLHSAHHICLLVPDVQTSLVRLRKVNKEISKVAPRLGRNNRWLFNIYDPDGTRIEYMEPGTFR